MRLELEAFGETQFSREILRVGQNAGNMRPAFDEVHDLLRKTSSEQFSSQGRYSGGWTPLAPATVAYKARNGLDPRILHATLRLRNSLTQKNARDHVYRATADEMFAGSRVPYGVHHQFGTERMPRRRPVELTEIVKQKILKILQAHLVSGGRM